MRGYMGMGKLYGEWDANLSDSVRRLNSKLEKEAAYLFISYVSLPKRLEIILPKFATAGLLR